LPENFDRDTEFGAMQRFRAEKGDFFTAAPCGRVLEILAECFSLFSFFCVQKPSPQLFTLVHDGV
jgi:hypothetical protein